MYKHSSVYGMGSGSFESGYNSSLGGITLGVDYAINDMFRVGTSLNMGKGYTVSTGDFNETTSDFDFWGVSLYGVFTQDNFALIGNVSYTGTTNYVTQEMPTTMQMSDLETEVNSHAWTVGLRAEYLWKTSVMDIVPHASVRYTSVYVDAYDTTSDGDTLFSVDTSTQTIWSFPVGVTFSKSFENDNDWIFTPQIDLGFIASAGDLNAKSYVSMPGVDYSTRLDMQNVDGFAFNGSVGFEFSKDNFSLDLKYALQASEHETSQMVYGMVRYEF